MIETSLNIFEIPKNVEDALVATNQETRERVKEKLFGAKGIGVNPSMTIEDDKENFVKTPEQSPYVKEMKVKEKREKEVVLRAI